MFWIAFFFVLLVFHDLILPDFSKPAKEWMPQIMVCAVIAVMVILKLAQTVALPSETWREFKKIVGLRGAVKNDLRPFSGRSRTTQGNNLGKGGEIMAWILICGIAVFLSSEAALVLAKSPLTSHPFWGRVLWGLISLPTWAVILYGLCLRPIILTVRKVNSGATWVDALGSHCLELGVFLFFIVPANLMGPGSTFWPGLAGTAIFKFFHYCSVANERQLERLVRRHAPRLRYDPQELSHSARKDPKENRFGDNRAFIRAGENQVDL